MIVDKFLLFLEEITRQIGYILPGDITLWISALVMLTLVVAAWRMVH